jgi:pimeloyl-ACP methyl ester carboxylesterase
MISNRSLAWFIALGALHLASCAQLPSEDGESSVAIGEARSELTLTDFSFTASLRGAGSADVHAAVYTNTDPKAKNGINVLAVHGFAETGFTYGPLANALFSDSVTGRAVKRVIGLHIPGHGDSGFPTGLPAPAKFGDLAIDDNVSVVLQTIEALRAGGLGPRIIMGHSMGGLEVQAAQEALLAQGSSFAAKGIFGAILLAPVPPHDLPWVRPATQAPTFITDPVLGTYLQISPEGFAVLGFLTLAGVPAPNAPTPAQVTANRWTGLEPFFTTVQLVEATLPLPNPPGGTITLQRPTVRAGAFAANRGTLLLLVPFSQDTLVPIGNLGPLYDHLTGTTNRLLYRPVVAADAVHNMFISNPAGAIGALRSMF